MDDHTLETLLRNNHPQPSPDFAQRIIMQAQMTKQQPPANLFNWLQRLFTQYHLPQPVYSCALMLVLGLMLGIGFNAEQPYKQPASQRNAATMMHMLLYPDEELL